MNVFSVISESLWSFSTLANAVLELVRKGAKLSILSGHFVPKRLDFFGRLLKIQINDR